MRKEDDPKLSNTPRNQEITRVILPEINVNTIFKLVSHDDQVFWRQVSRLTRIRHEKIEEILNYDVWSVTKEKINQSDVIVYIDLGGIGDTLYSLLDAIALAEAFPQKIIAVYGGRLLELIDNTKLSNLILFRKQEELSLYIKTLRHIPTTFLYLSEDHKEEIMKLYRRFLDKSFDFLMHDIYPKKSKKFPNLKLSKILKVATPYDTPYLYLLQHFGISNKAELDDFFSHEKNLEAKKPYDYFSLKPQILVRIAKLRYLLGLNPENVKEYLKRIPISFEEYASNLLQFDLLIAYDAKSDKRKVLSPEVISKIIQKRRKNCESGRIGILVGRDNPDIAREIRSRYPEATLLEGDISTCLSHIMSSKRVITADTFWMHALNIAVHYREQTGKKFHIPEFTVLWNDRSPFSPLYFGPDRGEILLTSW